MSKELCFSCYDHMMFQLVGQTKEYVETSYSLKYIEWYKNRENEIIICEICGSNVKYEKNEKGQWIELVINE